MDFGVYISLFLMVDNTITLFNYFFRDFRDFREFRGFDLANIFATLLHEIDSRVLTTGNTQLIRQNYFSLNLTVRTFVCFFRKRHHT